MAALTLYGSNHASALLTNACDMYTSTGATETNFAVTIGGGAGAFAELFSNGGASNASATQIVPPSHGWAYKPGAGTFASGNFAISANLAYNNTGHPFIFSLYQYNGSTYTLIGSLNVNVASTAKTDYTGNINSAGILTFAANDLLYLQIQIDDSSGAAGQITTLYEANSASQGVANDIQITTTNFTASGGGVTHHIICDGMSGMFS